jgi:hypothetical protein
MPQINCSLTISGDWMWNSGPAIGGQHNQFPSNIKTLYSTIDIPVDSEMWYSLQLVVSPGRSYGYAFVQFYQGLVRCKVMAPKLNQEQEGVRSATIDGLTVTAG